MAHQVSELTQELREIRRQISLPSTSLAVRRVNADEAINEWERQVTHLVERQTMRRVQTLTKFQGLSRTQVLLTMIIKLCSEIHDIKNSQNKYHLSEKGNTKDNTTNLSKISNIHCSHNPVSLDTCAYHDQHGDNSSHNIPSSPSHPACRKNIALSCELSLSYTQSSPAPPEGGCQGHSTQCSQRDKCLFCGQTSPTSHCQ